jgi:DNA-binding Lrp family transcriptional regulator
MSELSAGERDLLALLQGAFPLVPTPFASLGNSLMWHEREVLSRTWALKARGLLRQIGAIFDTRRLGYASTLVALAVDPARLEEVGRVVGRHPGVSHDYGRVHAYNLWFTLAVPPGADLEREVDALAAQPGVRRWLMLPTVRTFKIDTRFRLREGERTAGGVPSPCGAARPGAMAEGPPAPRREGKATAHALPRDGGDGVSRPGMAVEDIPYVRALQEDLPLSSRPFLVLARRYELTEAGLLARAEGFLAGGVMRRYGATVRHRQAGYTANAMVCWQLPEEQIGAAGEAAALHPAVSHCYQRPAYPPDWPYQLFTMVHARTEDELRAAVEELRDRLQPQAMAVLPTEKEFKKARLRYFEG